MFRSCLIAIAVLALALILIPAAAAQTFTVLHAFSGTPDGAAPFGGVTIDRGGNVYGATWVGGTGNAGMLFEIKPSGSGYLYYPLYSFMGDGRTGAYPYTTVAFGPGGALYGTTQQGGYNGCAGHGSEGCGVVFSARPKATFCGTALCAWTASTTYAFQGITSGDGNNPYMGSVAFDQAGNLYGTTQNDGPYGGGTVFELSHSNGGWTETILHAFGNTGDGSRPEHSVVIDSVGNLYGTTTSGGQNGYGTVFQLVHSGSGWTENTLYDFSQTLGGAANGVILDAAGNLYGGSYGYFNSYPSVFELSPSGSGWQLSVLATLSGNQQVMGNMVLDSHGNLYGATFGGGTFGSGMLFRLSPSGGSWNLTDVHDFITNVDGQTPTGDLTMDAHGSVYGTTQNGGGRYAGTVWKFTP